jgi:hypothetical protein
MLSIHDLQEYRQERKELKDLLSPENKNFF